MRTLSLTVATAVVAALFTLPTQATAAPVHRVLFDDTKAETAGNADWIISTSQPDPTAQNPSPQKETDWTGALSAWGVALQKTGQYSLRTLPAGNTITYGNTANSLDLSNFDEFVLPEPNVLLSASEKAAVIHFVQNGGGLFLISDHTGSDRNNDGADSPKIINDLMTNNGVASDPFGISVDLKNISSDHPVAITSPGDPILNGPFGSVHHSLIANGTTFTLNPSHNGTARGLVYLSTATPGNTNAFFATSTFGSGRVALWGDSSTIDDGTGQSGNTLFNGWTDPTADNAALGLNATAWLAGSGTTGGGGGGTCSGQLQNPGFESGATGWTATASVIGQHGADGEPPRTGTWDAWLDGYGSAHTDTVSQSVTLPAGCSTYQLSFWLHVDTAETGTTAFDTLKVTAGGSTLATFSNVDAAAGYQQHTVSLAAFAGQTVTVTFTGTEGSVKQTSFVLDDTALTVT